MRVYFIKADDDETFIPEYFYYSIRESSLSEFFKSRPADLMHKCEEVSNGVYRTTYSTGTYYESFDEEAIKAINDSIRLNRA